MEQGSQLSPANWPDVEFGTRLGGKPKTARDSTRRQLPTLPGQAAFAAIVAWAHQTSSSKADFVATSRLASMSSMGLFAPIGRST